MGSDLLDAVIVGGGLAGLSAARRLVAEGATVAVLEARDRVGGRTLTQTVGSDRIDLGGQWIGPTQDRMARLARELGVATFPTFADGKKVLDLRGALRTYTGTIPSLPLPSLIELHMTLGKLERMRKQVPLDQPAEARHALEWDDLTVESWRRKLLTGGVADMMGAALGAIFGCEARELSLLYFLFYLNSGGGLMRLIEIKNGAQQDRFVGGSQQISERLADGLGERVHRSSPVREIEQDAARVTVRTDEAMFRARRVIVAMAPTLAGRIRYRPELPAARDQLTQRMPMGYITKCIAVYERAFWREAGFSGEAVSDRGPVRLVFDDSSHDGAQPALLGFISGDDARTFGQLAADDRRAQALASFVRFFGPAAAAPVAYVEKDWAADPWSGGCPVGLMAPGTLSRYGQALRQPVGRVHWAGTETATEWCGYMEGAVASGERVADEVLAAVRR